MLENKYPIGMMIYHNAGFVLEEFEVVGYAISSDNQEFLELKGLFGDVFYGNSNDVHNGETDHWMINQVFDELN